MQYDPMTLQKMNDNKWKYISFVLMGIIALPGVTAISAPQAFAAVTDSIVIMVTDIQSKVNNTIFGLQAIKNSINALQTSINTFQGTTNTNLDAKVSTRATQTSVDNLQTSANAIKAKTDNLANTKAVVINKQMTVPAQGYGTADLIPSESGKTFSGHISMEAFNTPDGSVSVICVVNNNSIYVATTHFQVINADFACEKLVVEFSSHESIPLTANFQGVMQYVETSNVSTLN